MPDQREVRGAQFVAADDRDGSNARARVTVSFALVAFLTSCSLLVPRPEPVPKPEPARPVKATPPNAEPPPPEPPSAEKKITRNDQVILLPKADGSVGAIVVRQEGVEIVLDKAYASAVIEGPGQVRQLIRDPEATKETFAASLAALPPKPAKRVHQLLLARGIPPVSISIAGRGERELLIPTRDKVHEPRNRRVEINVR